MARRKRTGTGTDIMTSVASLPWWVGLTLAIISYLFFHWLATRQIATSIGGADQTANLAAHTIITGFASIFQYIIPMLCLACAAASRLLRKKRERLVTDVAQSKAADALDGMDWQSFELLVGEAFRLQGYTVSETGGGGADGGVDLVLSRDGEKYLVQCKQWKAFKVGVEIVRELFGVMAARGATGGFVVTSGRYTEPAVAFSNGRNIELIDGPKLKTMIDQAQSGAAHPSAKRSNATRSIEVPAPVPLEAPSPTCPKCAKTMIKRITKRGSSPGLAFWGCSGFPACRGFVPIKAAGA